MTKITCVSIFKLVLSSDQNAREARLTTDSFSLHYPAGFACSLIFFFFSSLSKGQCHFPYITIPPKKKDVRGFQK